MIEVSLSAIKSFLKIHLDVSREFTLYYKLMNPIIVIAIAIVLQQTDNCLFILKT